MGVGRKMIGIVTEEKEYNFIPEKYLTMYHNKYVISDIQNDTANDSIYQEILAYVTFSQLENIYFRNERN